MTQPATPSYEFNDLISEFYVYRERNRGSYRLTPGAAQTRGLEGQHNCGSGCLRGLMSAAGGEGPTYRHDGKVSFGALNRHAAMLHRAWNGRFWAPPLATARKRGVALHGFPRRACPRPPIGSRIGSCHGAPHQKVKWPAAPGWRTDPSLSLIYILIQYTPKYNLFTLF